MSNLLMDRPKEDEAPWEVISQRVTWTQRSIEEEDRQSRALLARLWSSSPKDLSYRIP